MLLEGSLCVVGSVRHHPTVGAYHWKRFGRGGVGSFGFNLSNPTYQPYRRGCQALVRRRRVSGCRGDIRSSELHGLTYWVENYLYKYLATYTQII